MMTIFEIVKNRSIFDIVREKLLTEDKHSNYREGDLATWKSGVYKKTKHGWEKVPGQNDGYKEIKVISDVLKTKKPLTVQNSKLGKIDIVYNETGHGLRHIIQRRFDEQYKKGKGEKDINKIKENITASLCCIFDTVKNAKEIKLQKDKNSWILKKDGFSAIIKKKNGKFLFTGFYDHSENRKATDSIRRVNLKYRYTPNFLDMYGQVGAVLSDIGSIPQKD